MHLHTSVTLRTIGSALLFYLLQQRQQAAWRWRAMDHFQHLFWMAMPTKLLRDGIIFLEESSENTQMMRFFGDWFFFCVVISSGLIHPMMNRVAGAQPVRSPGNGAPLPGVSPWNNCSRRNSTSTKPRNRRWNKHSLDSMACQSGWRTKSSALSCISTLNPSWSTGYRCHSRFSISFRLLPSTDPMSSWSARSTGGGIVSAVPSSFMVMPFLKSITVQELGSCESS